MKIETKFNVGEEVWIMHENKPKAFEITDIYCHQYGTGDDSRHLIISITYKLYNLLDYFEAEYFFKTKEELLKSL